MRWSCRCARGERRRGHTRFCMGAAWRGPKDRGSSAWRTWFAQSRRKASKPAATLGMLKDGHVRRSSAAGLDFYNHSLDYRARDFDGDIVSTRRLPGPPRHACAVRDARHPQVRRHRRHGRNAPAARRFDRAAREPRSPSRIGADQPSGAGRRHAASHGCGSALDPFEFVRTIARRAHHDAEGDGAALRRAARS